MAVAKKATEAKPASSDDKTTTLTSPWGSKVTVANDSVEALLDGGFKK